MEAPKEVEPCKAIWNLNYYFFVVPKLITRGLGVAITKENTDVTTLTRLSAGSSNNRFGHELFLVCANFNTRSIKPLLTRRHSLRKKMENTFVLSKQIHHERQELCTNRPRYRQGKKLTAVKVKEIIPVYSSQLCDVVHFH